MSTSSLKHYDRVAQAVEYIAAHSREPISVAQLAKALAMSESSLQHSFKTLVGLSPLQLQQFWRKQTAQSLLPKTSVQQAALQSGYGGSARLHDLLIRWQAVTPGDVQRGGEHLTLRYGEGDTPWGRASIALSDKGICKLAFIESGEQALAELKTEWPHAEFVADPKIAKQELQQIFNPVKGAGKEPLALLMRGSPFQLQVWQALMAIPDGEIRSYQQVAAQIGQPAAVRAVASAIGQNRIAWLIPCHRVIRASGELAQYRWGATRKTILLAAELGSRIAGTGLE